MITLYIASDLAREGQGGARGGGWRGVGREGGGTPYMVVMI